MKANGTTRLLSVFATVVFCVLAAGSMEDRAANHSGTLAQPEAAALPVITVSAGTLHQAYHRNEVAADSAYKGRSLLVTGMVTSIDKDFMDDVVLRLATVNEFETVDAHLQKSEESTAGQTEKGQLVKLLCTGGGMAIGSPTLNDCTFSAN